MNTNGKPPRKHPRTRSHIPMAQPAPERPPPVEADGSASGPAEPVAGRIEASGEAPSSPDPNGRDDLGRFGPGNTASRGHSGHRKVSEMRRAALEAETPARVARVLSKMFDLAEAGDVSAAKVYLENVVGKPIQGVEISGPDGSPLARSAELSTALGAALSPFSEEVRFAVIATLKRTIDAGRTE